MIAPICVYVTRENKDLHWVGHLSLMLIETGGQGRDWTEEGVWYLGKNSKGKVKCTVEQALSLCTGPTAHRGSRGIDLLFLDHGTRRG